MTSPENEQMLAARDPERQYHYPPKKTFCPSFCCFRLFLFLLYVIFMAGCLAYLFRNVWRNEDVEEEFHRFFQKRYTERCTPTADKCVTTFLYYFQCCSGECCLQLQPIPYVIAFVITLSVTYLSFASVFYCCIRNCMETF